MRGGFGGRITSEGEEDFSIKDLDKKTVKFFFNYLKKYKMKIFFAVLAMLMVSLATLAGPYLSKVAVDKYIAAGDLNGLNIIFVFNAFILWNLLDIFVPSNLSCQFYWTKNYCRNKRRPLSTLRKSFT